MRGASHRQAMLHGGLAMAEMGGGAYTAIGEEIRASVLDEGRIGIINYSDAQLAKWREAAQSVHKAWIDETPRGQAVYDAAVAALSQMRGSN